MTKAVVLYTVKNQVLLRDFTIVGQSGKESSTVFFILIVELIIFREKALNLYVVRREKKLTE